MVKILCIDYVTVKDLKPLQTHISMNAGIYLS